ncbi:MAG: hypothetical protein K2N51_12150 [Lachnospiraceae bacterium]|nr:hypothetical protein [Lachnospiraceae bacterium]
MEKEEYVYGQIMKNKSMFNDSEIAVSKEYIMKLRRK